MAATKPRISQVDPAAAIPGGEFQIHGAGLSGDRMPKVLFGDVPAPVVISSAGLVVAKVP
jgi:hypothetical protein